jgi:hypothetical protein
MIRELAQHIAQKAISENIFMPFALYESEGDNDFILSPMACNDLGIVIDIYIGLMKGFGENYVGILCVPIAWLMTEGAKAIDDGIIKMVNASDIKSGYTFISTHGTTIIEAGIFTQSTVIPIPYPQGGNLNVTLN